MSSQIDFDLHAQIGHTVNALAPAFHQIRLDRLHLRYITRIVLSALNEEEVYKCFGVVAGQAPSSAESVTELTKIILSS